MGTDLPALDERVAEVPITMGGEGIGKPEFMK